MRGVPRPRRRSRRPRDGRRGRRASRRTPCAWRSRRRTKAAAPRRRSRAAARPPRACAARCGSRAVRRARDRALGLLLGERLAVPALLVREERHAVSLLGPCDHQRGAVRALGLRVRRVDRGVTSWPSASTTCQPNAPARSAYASMSHSSIVGPRWPSRFTSRIPIRLSAPWCDAFANASQTDPSADSESPSRHHTRAGRSSIFWASAIPSAIGSPCPSEPVATSTHGMVRERYVLDRRPEAPERHQLFVQIAPTAFSVENISGEAWPFDRTKRSFARLPGRRRRSAGDRSTGPP